MDNIEIKSMLDDLISFVADDNFEGWATYWEDHEDIVHSIWVTLLAWEAIAKAKSATA